MRTTTKIFLVDDDPFCLAIYQQHLQNIGYPNTNAYSSGRELLDNLHQKPEIIFLDYNLEDYKGAELLLKIKEFDPAICVVIVSAQSDSSIPSNLLNTGAFDYIIKDYDDTVNISAVINKWFAAKK